MSKMIYILFKEILGSFCFVEIECYKEKVEVCYYDFF